MTVTPPAGVTAPTVTFVSFNAANPQAVVATYQFTAPGGAWTQADNVVYTVNMVANQVSDANGSVLTDDFRPDSDVDVLVRFEMDAPWSLLDIVEMKQELARLLGRDVDLAEREAVEESRNPFRRHSILSTARVVYAREPS